MEITVGTNEGKTHQIEVEDSKQLVGKEIGDRFKGSIVGLEGFTLEITGGSDKQGFPMRSSIEGPGRKNKLIEDGEGIDEEREGVRRRKSIRGRQVSAEIQQLNTKVVENGNKSIEEALRGEEDEE